MVRPKNVVVSAQSSVSSRSTKRGRANGVASFPCTTRAGLWQAVRFLSRSVEAAANFRFRFCLSDIGYSENTNFLIGARSFRFFRLSDLRSERFDRSRFGIYRMSKINFFYCVKLRTNAVGGGGCTLRTLLFGNRAFFFVIGKPFWNNRK